MSDVIKEFLVALNYKVNGERDLADSVNRATKSIGVLVTSIAAATGAIALATSKAAQGLERLYYMSQRTSASAQNIKAFGFAAGQLGSSAESAADAVENLAQKIKETGGDRGGIAGLLRGLGVTTSSGGRQRDTADVLVDVGRKLATLAPNVARAYANALGIDEKTLNALMSGKFADLMRDNAAKAKAMGFDINSASKDSVGFMNQLRELGDTIQMLFLKVLSKAFGTTGDGFKTLNDLIVRNAGKISDTLVAVINLVLKLAQQFIDWLSDEKVTKGVDSLSTSIGEIGTSLKNWNTSLDGFLERLQKAVSIIGTIEKWSAWLGDKVLGDKKAPNAFGWGNAGRWGEIPDNRTALERILPNGWGGKPAPGASTGDAARRPGKGASMGPGQIETNAFYASIIKAEGTGKYGDPYNTWLGYDERKNPPPKPLTQMSIDEAIKWGEGVRKRQGLNSSAKGAFQITNDNMRKFKRAWGLKGDEIFDEKMQKRMASSLARGRPDLGDWEGFKHHEDQRRIGMAELRKGTDRDMRPSTIASAVKKIGDAISPGGAQAAPSNRSPASPFGSIVPLGAGAQQRMPMSVTNNFSPTNNVTVMGGGPDMAPILGRTLERSNNDLLRNGVGAFN